MLCRNPILRILFFDHALYPQPLFKHSFLPVGYFHSDLLSYSTVKRRSTVIKLALETACDGIDAKHIILIIFPVADRNKRRKADRNKRKKRHERTENERLKKVVSTCLRRIRQDFE
jgi:hypothetical protein